MKNTVVLLAIVALAIGIFLFIGGEPSHVESYNTAVGYLKDGSYKEAIPYLEQADASKPDDKRVLEALQEAYFETGQLKKSEEIRNRLLKL